MALPNAALIDSFSVSGLSLEAPRHFAETYGKARKLPEFLPGLKVDLSKYYIEFGESTEARQ